jgi:hypothetical protein
MAAHVLITVENISVGQDGTGGLLIDCLIHGISNDGTIRAELDGLQDDFSIYTDLGTTPLEYYRLIVSECLAYLNPLLSIDIKEQDVIVLGWDDARFYGTSSYEDVDEFLRWTPYVGKLRWGQIISGYTGTNLAATGIVGMGSSPNHPGYAMLQSGASTGTYCWAVLVHPRGWWLPVVKRMAWVTCGTPDVNYVNKLIGLCNTPAVFAGNTYYIMLQQYQGGATTTGNTWQIAYKDLSGAGTAIPTTISAVSGQNNWIEFEMYQVSAVPETYASVSAYALTYEMTVRDLSSGYEEYFTRTFHMPSAQLFFAQWGVQTIQLNGAVRIIYADQFRYSLSNLTRVLPEY